MFFVPLIIGAGGNCGAQVTTTLTRSLAIGDVQTKDWLRVLRREVATAVLIGLTLGLLGFLRAYLGWSAGVELSLVVAISLPIVVLWASSVGSLLPLAAKRLGIDPAVMSAPFITTFVDATGLVIYFEIALRVLRG
jgi:magnesium transporter